jgi:hypothetical protein
MGCIVEHAPIGSGASDAKRITVLWYYRVMSVFGGILEADGR